MSWPDTAFAPPADAAAQVARTGVRDTVCGSQARLVLVRAPAGFGKTTVMGQCRERLEALGVATAWLTVGRADNDPSRFLSRLDALVAQALPELAEAATDADLPEAAPAQRALSLVSRLAAAEAPFALFLDEFEAVHEGAVLALVRELLERLPPGGRLVIGTRWLPDLRLARLRARGQLLEVDASRLRFSLEETRRFFDLRVGVPLDDAALAALHERTEGWVAALWLVGLAMASHPDPGGFVARFTAADAGIAEYLAEEVLARQEPALRRFLLRTSLLREVSLPLAEALAPDVAPAEVARLFEAAANFLTPVEGRPGARRYHSLLAGHLRAQLMREAPAEVQALHAAAARGFLARGETFAALDHLIDGGDLDGAVAVLAQVAMDLLCEGRLRMLGRWFDRIPAAALAAHPLLQAVKIWSLCFLQGPQAATAMLAATGLAGRDDPAIRMHVAALRMVTASQLDQWDEAYAEGRAAMARLPSGAAFADTYVVNALASTAIMLGRYDEARPLLDAARRAQGREASPFHRMFSEVNEGMIDWMEGRLRQAAARFRLAVQVPHHEGLGLAHGNVWGGLMVAATIYETDDLAQAERLLRVYLPLARDVWLPDHIIMGHGLLSRIAFLAGDIDQSLRQLTELEYLGHQRRIPRLAASARVERARLLLLQRNVEAAEVELQRADDPVLWTAIAAHRYLAHDQGDMAIARLRWQLHAAHLRPEGAVSATPVPGRRETRTALEALLREAEAGRRHRRALKLRWMLALALAAEGDAGAALEQATRTLRAAAAEGARRVLLDEGPLASGLLEWVARSRQAGGSPEDPLLDDFLQSLLASPRPWGVEALPSGQGTGAGEAGQALAQPLEPLTRKELRLLQLLAEGYSNTALTEKLFVSNSTVRTHLRNINGKLGAHNRTQAVAIGRRMGLIR